VARNRKRAKDRRARRPANVPVSRPGVATARPERDERDEVPGPLQHATPDAELAEAQLALGRPDLVGDEGFAGPEDEYEYAPDEEEREPGEGDLDGGSGGGGGSDRGELTPAGAPGGSVPARRRLPGNRLINFLQGSWRELQRVQWPDRQQVMQATGVVIGFVIVAGVFLGVADTLAGKIVNLILK
jgi:preprotein translocase SecE subunit